MNKNPMTTIRGCIPVAPTAFTENEELDLHGQRRIVDFLVDGGVDAVCVLANYSEQFSLSDTERDQVIDATLDRAAGKIPVVVATSHYSARIAAERSRAAQDRGAAMVMLMPPFYGASLNVNDDGIVEFFKRVADGLTIDIMIQDSPLSSSPLSTSLLLRLAAEVPQLRYAKIEVPRSAEKIRALSSANRTAYPGLYDGEEAITLFPDLDAGAQGTMSSCLLGTELSGILRSFHTGAYDEARAEWERLLPLIHFENRQCGLSGSKFLMAQGGIIASDRVRAPQQVLAPQTREELFRLARERDPFILRWGK